MSWPTNKATSFKDSTIRKQLADSIKVSMWFGTLIRLATQSWYIISAIIFWKIWSSGLLAVWQAYRKNTIYLLFAREALRCCWTPFLIITQSRQSVWAGIWQRYTAAWNCSLTLINATYQLKCRTKMIEKWLKLYYNERIYLEKRY